MADNCADAVVVFDGSHAIFSDQINVEYKPLRPKKLISAQSGGARSAGTVVTAEHGKHPGARGLSIEVDPEEALVTQAAPRSAMKPLRHDFMAAIGEFVPGVEQGQHGQADNLWMPRPSSVTLPAPMLADGTGVEACVVSTSPVASGARREFPAT
jgi:hypothetical protein